MTTELAPVTYGEVKTGLTGFVIAPRGAGQVNIYNGDITDVLLVSKNPTPVAGNSLPVQPLTNATIDTTNGQYYATAAPGGGSVLNVTVSAAAQLSPSPAQIAQQISALGLATAARQDIQAGGLGQSIATDMLNANKGVTTEVAALVATGSAVGAPGGVPLLRKTTQLASQTTEVTVGAGVVQTIVNSVNTNQPAYEMSLTIRFPTNAGTIPFGDLLIEWFDAASGIAIDIFECVLAGGNNQQIFFNVYGPNRGDQIFIRITNLDPVQNMFVTWIVNATSHVYERDRLIQPGYQSNPPNGFQNPAGNVTSGMLATTSPTIGPNASTTRLVAAYNGMVDMLIDDGAQANDVVVKLTDPGTLYSSNANAPIWVDRITAGLRRFVQDIAFPNGNVLMTITNGGATNTIVPTVTLMRKGY